MKIPHVTTSTGRICATCSNSEDSNARHSGGRQGKEQKASFYQQ